MPRALNRWGDGAWQIARGVYRERRGSMRLTGDRPHSLLDNNVNNPGCQSNPVLNPAAGLPMILWRAALEAGTAPTPANCRMWTRKLITCRVAAKRHLCVVIELLCVSASVTGITCQRLCALHNTVVAHFQYPKLILKFVNSSCVCALQNTWKKRSSIVIALPVRLQADQSSPFWTKIIRLLSKTSWVSAVFCRENSHKNYPTLNCADIHSEPKKLHILKQTVQDKMMRFLLECLEFTLEQKSKCHFAQWLNILCKLPRYYYWPA